MEHPGSFRSADVYDRYVKEYVNRFMNLDLYKDTFDSLVKLLPLNARMLELGCGPGNVVKYLKQQRSDLDILGIDLSPEMIKEARKQNPGARFQLMDIKNANELQQRFDGVVAAFSLPYLPANDVDIFFDNCKQLTAEDGLFYLSCMEGLRARSGFEKTSFTGDDELYINYYPREEIELRLQDHRLKIESFYTVDYPEADGTTTTDLIYITRSY